MWSERVIVRSLLDDAYATFHTDADYPVLKFLQEPVYFEVELKGTKLADISLELDSCWATLDSDRFSQPRWNLIIKGYLCVCNAFCQIVAWVEVLKYLSFSCVNPVDPYKVIFHPVPVDKRVNYPSHFKRFEVQMFAFADEDNLSHQVNLFYIFFSFKHKLKLASVIFPQVFVHCDIFVCDAKNPQDGVCDKLCYEKETGKGRFWWSSKLEILKFTFVVFTGQKRAASDDRRLQHVISGPILVI